MSSPSIGRDGQAVEPLRPRDLEHHVRRRRDVGDAHVGDDAGALALAGGERAAHPRRELRIVAALGIELAIAMAERQRPLADRLEHEIVELALFGEIDRRLQPIRRKAGATSQSQHEAFLFGVALTGTS